MSVISDLAKRVLPENNTPIDFYILKQEGVDSYEISFKDGRLVVKANCIVAAAHGLYVYLKKYCRVNLSWNGNSQTTIKELVPFDGRLTGKIEQKYRVYMNYCTLNYSMSWWDFSRWEKELDYMALNGINMPLAVIGTEAVWFETLKEYGYTDDEALKTISGPAFWAWQLMTNIEGYIPPTKVSYVYDRLELGKKILNRMVELNMYPIQQGFSGHVPMSMIEKFPQANIIAKSGWAGFDKTAQLDPLDPMFEKLGLSYLKKQKELLGAYHYYAADPFHEGAPPKKSASYLKKVGMAIDNLIKTFDSEYTWVMQAWSIRKHIAKAADKARLLILDLNSAKYKFTRHYWGRNYILGYLHNFGAKNVMQGRIPAYTKNLYWANRLKHPNAVGSGMFMEGIEQNPFVYDLIFQMMTAQGDIDLPTYIRDYIERRYGKYDANIAKAYEILMKTCYKDGMRQDFEIGSTLVARPGYMPIKSSPCDRHFNFYDNMEFEKALIHMLKADDAIKSNDGYQFDLMDIAHEVLSNRFYDNQLHYKAESISLNVAKVEEIAKNQLQILLDLDDLLSCRSEYNLAKWIGDAHNLASDEELRKYYDYNARLLITLWGDVNGSCFLHDYAWKEWAGLIKEYYYPRWEMFYNDSLNSLKQGRLLNLQIKGIIFGRPHFAEGEFYSKLADFEKNWCKTYKEYPYPQNKDVYPVAVKIRDQYIKH